MILILLLGAYLIGSLPLFFWFCRWVKGVDIRAHGSGNIGATNAARVLGKKYFLPFFLIDAGKAFFVLYCVDGFYLYPNNCDHRLAIQGLISAALLVGNGYSCFLSFRGGKGVATVVGIIGYLFCPITATAFCVIWLIVLAITRHAFMASLIAIGTVSAVAIALYPTVIEIIAIFGFMCFWLVLRHHENIKKWLKHEI